MIKINDLGRNVLVDNVIHKLEESIARGFKSDVIDIHFTINGVEDDELTISASVKIIKDVPKQGK